MGVEANESKVDINELLRKTVQRGASDLHIKVGSPPIIRISGTLIIMEDEPKLTGIDTNKIASAVLNDYHRNLFENTKDIDVAYSVPGLGRFRCNCFTQRGTTGFVFRVIPMDIKTIDGLKLPKVLKKVAAEARGLVLVTGSTGSGKSTTLAAIIDEINTTRHEHIMTIEDPIEFLHKDKMSIVNQRETGSDTESFGKALKASLRQDPDVILVGEMRDHETIETALVAAETGHLVLSTLHTMDAAETVNRIIAVFPPHQHQQMRIQLASVLRAIISQRLVPTADGKGRVAAVEVLIATKTIKGCIEDKDKTGLINDYIAEGASQYGMQTFDQSLLSLYKDNLITYEDALARSTNPDDFALMVKGVQSTKTFMDDDRDKAAGGKYAGREDLDDETIFMLYKDGSMTYGEALSRAKNKDDFKLMVQVDKASPNYEDPALKAAKKKKKEPDIERFSG
ncbi:MAG: type IV pilus twitching motility protein PilT [Nitrospirae bacterium]|nr:type IV pilus twitching motility protein PilT [Nitrospirota bacterium]